MKWVLRNQKQVEEKFGKKFFQELKDSLDHYFKNSTDDEINNFVVILPEKGYWIKDIPSKVDPKKIFRFILMKREDDTFYLSFSVQLVVKEDEEYDWRVNSESD